MKKFLKGLVVWSILFAMAVPIKQTSIATASTVGNVVINEIAWMGTNVSYNDEWIELYNNSGEEVALTGWTLSATDGSPSIALSGSIPANGYFILERTDDQTVSGVQADLIYSGSLSNSGEVLELKDAQGNIVDVVDAWYAGDNDSKATMERKDPTQSGALSSNWLTATELYTEGYGTPKAKNRSTQLGCSSTEEHLNQVSEALGAINVYFNKCALTQYASVDNEANYNVNLENRLIHRLNQATTSIDFATYEINLPNVVDTLIQKAAQGVQVRVIADSKDSEDPYYAERFETMRLYVEKMVRGQDLLLGTSDDIVVFSDSPMFAVEDSTKRISFGLPSSASDIPEVTVAVGSQNVTGRLFVDAEEKAPNAYYSPDNQMHNKFAIVDGKWVFTGSWNFTVTGLYGDETNMSAGILDGNQQHVVEVHSPELAAIYRTEFEEMWGSSSDIPNPSVANFSSRKTDNTSHIVSVGGKTVEVYFSPGDDAIGKLTNLVKDQADYNTYFSIFAWSDQALLDELKYKWEGSYQDLEGTLTGFDLKGVFDSSYWNMWWSASVDMTGRTASQSSQNNPNTRWANPAPVYSDQETRKLHSKTMLIDAETMSDPTVVIGSTNWSENGNSVNDENMLIIHDDQITNQFVQEFYARYAQAGGQIPAN